MTLARAVFPPADSRSPRDWLAALIPKLTAQRDEAAVPEAYYDGLHPLQFTTSKFREAFGNMFGAFADNWCAICVDAPVERLQVTGFRIKGQDEADTDAWDIWQESGLDADSVIAHTEAGKCGKAFLITEPTGRITVEHPSQVYVETDPGDRRKRLAALKCWAGEDRTIYATVYLPEACYRFQSKGPVTEGLTVEWVGRRDGPSVVSYEFGVVPVIPLRNAPGLLRGGESDLKPAIPIQNAINKLCADMIIASEYGAFRQRVLTGVEVPRDPETGKPLARTELIAAMSRLWTFENPDAEVTDLPATDLGNFVTAIEMFKADFAAQTRTPPHYMLGQVVNAAADALKVAEAGLTSKCRRKILYFSDPWEESMSLALKAKGRDVSPAHLQVLWANPERTSIGELVDALVKKRTLGIPLEVLWAEMQYTPEEISDMKRLAGLPDRPKPGATTANAVQPIPQATDSGNNAADKT